MTTRTSAPHTPRHLARTRAREPLGVAGEPCCSLRVECAAVAQHTGHTPRQAQAAGPACTAAGPAGRPQTRLGCCTTSCHRPATAAHHTGAAHSAGHAAASSQAQQHGVRGARLSCRNQHGAAVWHPQRTAPGRQPAGDGWEHRLSRQHAGAASFCALHAWLGAAERSTAQHSTAQHRWATHLVVHGLAQPPARHGGELPRDRQDHELAQPEDAEVHDGWLPAAQTALVRRRQRCDCSPWSPD